MDQRWDEGVGAGGGQLGRSARTRRSLAVASHVNFKSPMGARPEATPDEGGSQPEERHGLAAAVLRITRRRRNPVRGGVWGHIPVPTIFSGTATRSMCYLYQPPLLNHANTVSVEDNLRKRTYSHSPANGTVTATTSLHAWCRDNISKRAVA
jgi:hypothetical protein